MTEAYIRTISLWQPWAQLVADQRKLIETRSWSTPYRGRLAIHAAKRADRLCRVMAKYFKYDWDELPKGAVIAVCDLVDVLPVEVALLQERAQLERDKGMGDYSTRRFCWFLENVHQVAPLPFVGRQGFFAVPAQDLHVLDA